LFVVSSIVVRGVYIGKYTPRGGISADIIWVKKYEKGKNRGKCEGKREKTKHKEEIEVKP
jgi:hypothetical protein